MIAKQAVIDFYLDLVLYYNVALSKSQKIEGSPILGIQVGVVLGNERGYGTMGGDDDEPKLEMKYGRTKCYVSLSDYKTGVFTVMRICIGEVDEGKRMAVSDTNCSIFCRMKKDSLHSPAQVEAAAKREMAAYGYAHLQGQVAREDEAAAKRALWPTAYHIR